MEVVRALGGEDAARRAGECVSGILKRCFREPLLLLLSGGSSLSVIKWVSPDCLGEEVTITVSDERYSEDNKVNNFAQITATDFYKNVVDRGCSFIDTRVLPGESLGALGSRFDEELHAWRAAHPMGKVIMTQGIGPDGHTCGIMPFPKESQQFTELFDNSSRWAVSYNAKEKNEHPLRVTVTLPFLREVVDESALFAVGEEKRDALARILSEEGVIYETPGRIVREMKSVKIFTDIAELL